jgi:fructose/tagatose bisphosphate aldolase
VDPRKILKEARAATKEAVREKMRLFGASGKVDV